MSLAQLFFRASRLGLDACLATKVGSDANGRLIMQGLEEEGVDVSRVIVSDKTPSAFTYIIVDKEQNTRTCLHTPQTEGAFRARETTVLYRLAVMSVFVGVVYCV